MKQWLLNIIKSLFYKQNKPINLNYQQLDNIKEIVFLHKDIVKYIKALDTMLNQDLYNKHLDKYAMLSYSKNSTTIKHWFTNNGRLIDINYEYSKWIELTTWLVSEFDKLNRIKKGNTIVSFNIRKLQPYIVNIKEIKQHIHN